MSEAVESQIARLKAMTRGMQRRLTGAEKSAAVDLAMAMRGQMECQLRDIDDQLKFLTTPEPTVFEHWRLPDAPVCVACGTAMQPHAEFDSDEVILDWVCDCGEQSEEPHIPWPWESGYVWNIDARAAGFLVN